MNETTTQRNEMLLDVYASHVEAETAIHELGDQGIDVKKFTLIGLGYHSEERILGYHTDGERIRFWGKLGAFVGSLMGVFFGTKILIVLGAGSLVLGPVVGFLVRGAAGAVAGGILGGIGASLIRLVGPRTRKLRYVRRLKADRYLLLYAGAREEIEEAKALREVCTMLKDVLAAPSRQNDAAAKVSPEAST